MTVMKWLHVLIYAHVRTQWSVCNYILRMCCINSWSRLNLLCRSLRKWWEESLGLWDTLSQWMKWTLSTATVNGPRLCSHFGYFHTLYANAKLKIHSFSPFSQCCSKEHGLVTCEGQTNWMLIPLYLFYTYIKWPRRHCWMWRHCIPHVI